MPIHPATRTHSVTISWFPPVFAFPRSDVPQIDSHLIIMNPADRGIDHPDENFAGCADGQFQHMTAMNLMLLIGQRGMEMNVRRFIHGRDIARQAGDFAEAADGFPGIFLLCQIINPEHGMFRGPDRTDLSKTDVPLSIRTAYTFSYF